MGHVLDAFGYYQASSRFGVLVSWMILDDFARVTKNIMHGITCSNSEKIGSALRFKTIWSVWGLAATHTLFAHHTTSQGPQRDVFECLRMTCAWAR